MRVTHGKYHPKPAKIYRKVTTFVDEDGNATREPQQTVELFCRVFIRIPRQWQMGMEQQVQKQTTSFGQCVWAMPSNSKTRQIDASMELHHDGVVYGLIAKIPLTEDLDEIEWLCQFKDQSTIYP